MSHLPIASAPNSIPSVKSWGDPCFWLALCAEIALPQPMGSAVPCWSQATHSPCPPSLMPGAVITEEKPLQRP
jgi:hypothetical protein